MAFRKRGGGGRQRRDNSGALFKNDRARGDKDPDYKGEITVAGRDYWISAWLNESERDGQRYLGLKLTPKNEERRQSYQRPGRRDDDFDRPARREARRDENDYARAREGDEERDDWRGDRGGMPDEDIPF